ncbi:hypothetical protein U1872_06475 [Sphingomonas sp. RB3P16]|uniref:phage tail tube protein n=1 Tax=Parasphingomonas frigoris TaxID=3096163 RepID=UPI002FCA4BFE
MTAIGNQTLGRGKVELSRFKTGTFIPEGFRYTGNTPDFALNSTSTTLQHWNSDGPIKTKDKSVILQVEDKATLTFDDINVDNMALFFLGSSGIITQTSGSSTTEVLSPVKAGYNYVLGITDLTPTGVRALTAVTVTKASTPLVANVDYTLDAARGTVAFIAGGAVIDGDSISVAYTRGAVNRTQVISGTTQIKAALRFVANNGEGDNIDFYMPYVRISPNGDFNLKSDDWQKLSVNVEILTAPNRAAIYADGQPYTAS